MKWMVLVGVLSIAAGCAMTESRPRPNRWEGDMFHNGLRSPVAVDLAVAENASEGQLPNSNSLRPAAAARRPEPASRRFANAKASGWSAR
jgi:hypothetical protein